MSSRAEYTLAQAVAMVNLIAEQWHQHFCFEDCEECVLAHWAITVCDILPSLSEYQYCPRGKQLLDNRAKWKRHCKYAARRSGVKMTVILDRRK